VDYAKLINQALREWLAAQNVKELVREELHEMLQIALNSVQPEQQAVRQKVLKK
jgi:hypothetical protein